MAKMTDYIVERIIIRCDCCTVVADDEVAVDLRQTRFPYRSRSVGLTVGEQWCRVVPSGLRLARLQRARRTTKNVDRGFYR